MKENLKKEKGIMVSFKHYHSFHFQPWNARLVLLSYQSSKIRY